MTSVVPIGEGSEALVGRGLPPDPLPPRAGRETVALVHQAPVRHVAERLAGSIDCRVVVRSVPDREEAKDLGVAAELYRWLASENLGRHDTIVGVGGGAVTDLAGFVAATWLRGVESVMVPTTLLAAVDAAIGGKTGVNLRLGEQGGGYLKNLVGAFWHPSRVLVDLDLLERLPRELLLEGTAEILKAGFVADPSIVEAYEQRGREAPLELVVPAAIRVKAAVVAGDFREAGRRAILNFGHTVGHAVEGVTGMPHGHAVAVGMVAEAILSRARTGFDDRRLVEVVSRLGLPTRVEGLPMGACLELVARDKKRSAEGLRVVLLREVGDPEVATVSEEELAAALASIGAR